MLADQRKQLVAMLSALERLGAVGTDVIRQSKDDTRANLEALAPILSQLNKAGDDLPSSMQLLLTYPFSDGTLAATRPVGLAAGITRVTFEVMPRDAGFHTFRAVVEAARDTFVDNDRADSNTIVKGEPRTLVLAGDDVVADLDAPGDDLGLGESLAEVGKCEVADHAHASTPETSDGSDREFGRPIARSTPSRMRSRSGRWYCSSFAGGYGMS